MIFESYAHLSFPLSRPISIFFLRCQGKSSQGSLMVGRVEFRRDLDAIKAKNLLGNGYCPRTLLLVSIDLWSMPVTSAVPRRRDLLELIMVAIYFVLTAFSMVSNSPPSLGLIFRQALSPFQIKVRARNTGAERSAAVWRLSQFESRVRRRPGTVPPRSA